MSGYPIGVAGWVKRYNEVATAQERARWGEPEEPSEPPITVTEANSIYKKAFDRKIEYLTWR